MDQRQDPIRNIVPPVKAARAKAATAKTKTATERGTDGDELLEKVRNSRVNMRKIVREIRNDEDNTDEKVMEYQAWKKLATEAIKEKTAEIESYIETRLEAESLGIKLHDQALGERGHEALIDAQRSAHEGRNLLGVVVRREVMRHSGSTSAFATTEGASKKALRRLFAGKSPLSWDKVSFIEGRLGLPRDTFVCVYNHEFDKLTEIGVEADLVGWIRTADRLFSDPIPRKRETKSRKY